MDPEFLQNSATGGVVGFSELDPTALETDPVALEDELDINAPPMDDFTMVDYGDDGYDMGGGFDIDMGGGYDMDMGMGDMDFGFWIWLIVQRYQTMAKWANLFVWKHLVKKFQNKYLFFYTGAIETQKKNIKI